MPEGRTPADRARSELLTFADAFLSFVRLWAPLAGCPGLAWLVKHGNASETEPVAGAPVTGTRR